MLPCLLIRQTVKTRDTNRLDGCEVNKEYLGETIVKEIRTSRNFYLLDGGKENFYMEIVDESCL